MKKKKRKKERKKKEPTGWPFRARKAANGRGDRSATAPDGGQWGETGRVGLFLKVMGSNGSSPSPLSQSACISVASTALDSWKTEYANEAVTHSALRLFIAPS